MAAFKTLCIIIIFCCFPSNRGQCPPTCTDSKGLIQTSNCCEDGNNFCCSGDIASKCLIERPRFPETINQVYIQFCSLPTLSKEVLKNISETSVSKLHLFFVTIGSVSNDTFEDFHTLKGLEIHCGKQNNLTGLGSAINNSWKGVNISVSVENCGIKNNHISAVVADIPVAKLRKFSLAKNLIKVLPTDELQNLRFTETIDLSNNLIMNVSSARETTTIINLNLAGNRLGLLTADRWHLLNGTFPKIKHLDLSANAIKRMEVVPWQIFPTLLKLNLSSNYITYLNFSHLSPAANLSSLDVSKNWLTQRSNESPVYSLKRLYLGSNNFATFPPWFCNNETDSYFPSLEYLDISDNLLRYPVRRAWSCLTKLQILVLSSNPFIKLKNNTFSDLVSLKKLDLSYLHGTVDVVETDFFDIPNLEYLDIQLSGILFNIQNISNIFAHLDKLIFLDMSFNRLNNFNKNDLTNLLSPLKNIRVLKLQNVNLYSLPSGLLGHFPSLIELNLNSNKFESRDLPGSFNSSINLKKLALSNNFIRVVKNTSFVGRIRETLQQIDLSNNPLDCNCDNLWFRDEIDKSQTGKVKFRYKNWPDKYRCRTPVAKSNQLFESFHMSEKDCAPLDTMLIAYITIGSFLFVFLVTAAIVIKFRWYITYWRYKMKRKKRAATTGESEPLLSSSFQYDAYVIYRHEDEVVGHFITKEFQPLVENLGYRFFFWDRDAGVGAKVSEIGDGIYGSKSVIAIVNGTFLNDPWCKFQIEVALDRQVEVKRQLLMFVVLEDVDFQLLNRSWCVRFTKSPTAKWCPDPSDIKRRLLETQIRNMLGDPEPKNRDALRQQNVVI